MTDGNPSDLKGRDAISEIIRVLESGPLRGLTADHEVMIKIDRSDGLWRLHDLAWAALEEDAS